MSTKKTPELQQFSFRVRKTVSCVVTVEAYSQEEARDKAENAGNWIDEQDDEVCDWIIRGRA